MTRFARAKGSKASNERIPDEPTPWHVIKRQLEDSLTTKECQEKSKSVKKLLAEKETPYYSTSIGNVKTDWADFEILKKKSKSEKISEPSASKKPLKQLKTNTRVKSDSSKIISEPQENQVLPPKTAKKLKKRKNNQDLTTVTSDPTDYTEKKKRKKEKLQSNDSNSIQNLLEVENKSESLKKTEGADSKKVLSKRQKRNRKNKKSNAAETFENSSDGKLKANDENQAIKREKSNGEMPQRENNMRENVRGKPMKKRKPPKVRDDKEHQRRKPLSSSKVIINGLEVEITMYDGFPVKKEDAKRLTSLRKELVMKGIPLKDINAAMKLERRKAEKALARVRKSVCFHCRKAGHNLSDCPELGKEECMTGICFKCGSTEHTHFECKVNKKEEFRFTSCFICRQQGHISKQCPDNPRGLYPDGGSCKICGDVTHLKKDCPDLVTVKEEATVTLQTIADNSLEALDGEKMKKIPESQPKNKVVKF